jgi:hypothetical protein
MPLTGKTQNMMNTHTIDKLFNLFLISIPSLLVMENRLNKVVKTSTLERVKRYSRLLKPPSE